MQNRWFYTLCFRIARMLVIKRPPPLPSQTPELEDVLTSLGGQESVPRTKPLSRKDEEGNSPGRNA